MSDLLKASEVTKILGEKHEQALQIEEKMQAEIDRMLKSPLSDRETEVLSCIASGLKCGDIARKLRISKNTVRNHVAEIRLKMGVNSTRAVVIALQHGWIKFPEEDSCTTF